MTFFRPFLKDPDFELNHGHLPPFTPPLATVAAAARRTTMPMLAQTPSDAGRRAEGMIEGHRGHRHGRRRRRESRYGLATCLLGMLIK